ncbi:MAG TPA: UvrD-helicase domain-containing protein [Mycobacteriales bacterium]|nr:UvrD-helicase domain-containing protein [Mycobacteriales bacterium]
MSFYADLHVHSKYSRACSRDCDLEHLTWWARRKGISLVGTGDFTHPAWNDHLHQMLVPAEPGLFRLRDDVASAVDRTVPASCDRPVRFMLSVEISTIYKRDDRTRKVHHLIYLPDLDAVARFNRALGRIGNLGSDGRPILGLDSRDLLEITLEASPDGYLVPAHIWTPWFSALGSKSGFDAIADCYADLAGHIFALETGLSSDPPMNWRVSSLDSYRLVSNSDAHSPPMLGREATAFGTDLDYFAVRDALRTGEGYRGSLEFFPEEGKYHLDGHRKCEVRLEPGQTREHGGRCPSCSRPLTVGVLHRVEALADRPDGARPEHAAPFRNLVPLPEMVGEILGVGPKSKRVDGQVSGLVARLGPELTILTETPVAEIERAGGPLLAEAVARLRRGEVVRDAGYDGEYGRIRLFRPDELGRPSRGSTLFDVEPTGPAPAAVTPVRPAPASPPPTATGVTAVDRPGVAAAPAAGGPAEPLLTGMELIGAGLLDRLDPDQRAAASVTDGPLLIVAGPGTGKTRTLTHRIAHLVADRGVPPERCLAITFTRRAADELRDRLDALAPGHSDRITVATFHGLGLAILREVGELAGLTADFRVADEAERLALLGEVTGSPAEARRVLAAVSRHRRSQSETPPGTAENAETADLVARYTKALRARDLVDFDDLVALPVALLTEHPDLADRYRQRWGWVSVDEYQDTDETQYRLLRLLVPTGGNLCAIGDPDQAIYRFRGADVGFFLRFGTDYPTATRVSLTRNYRSTPAIVAAAVQAIAPGSLVPDRVLEPVRRDADAARIGVHEASTEQAEAEFVARTVDQLLGGSSFHSLDSGRVDGRGGAGAASSFADVAVLYRTDAQARAVADALTRAGMPFQKRSHDRLADRPGVRAILAELRFAERPGGQPPPEGVGPVLDRVRRIARALIGRLPTYAANADEQAAEFHAAVELLAPLAEGCGTDTARFAAELALGAEVDTWDPRADRISLLTLHAAKGLEFPAVFVVGCSDGLLPLRLPGREPDAESVAEERRLLFVGMTRAREYLCLCHARQRARLGVTRETAVSPFLAAIDPALCERLGESAPRRPRATQMTLL